MPYSDTVANTCHSAFTSLVDTLEIITSGGTVLATITVAFGSPSVTSSASTATIGSTPINFTWSASGTVGGFRWKDASVELGSFIGSFAVGTVGSGAIIELTSLAATSGASAQVVSGTHSFPTKTAGEP